VVRGTDGPTLLTRLHDDSNDNDDNDKDNNDDYDKNNNNNNHFALRGFRKFKR
jgi:hypothetical protein